MKLCLCGRPGCDGKPPKPWWDGLAIGTGEMVKPYVVAERAICRGCGKPIERYEGKVTWQHDNPAKMVFCTLPCGGLFTATPEEKE